MTRTEWPPTRAGGLAHVLTSVAPTADGGTYIQQDHGRWSRTVVVGDAPAYESVPYRGTIVARPGGGYWVVTADGRIHARGGAPECNGGRMSHPTRAGALTGELIAASATPCGSGLVALGDDGRVWAAGDAVVDGDVQGETLSPAAIAVTATGRGYYIAGAGGEVACFGDAVHHGDAAGRFGAAINVVGIAVSKGAGDGYWLALLDGDVLPFGSAPFLGCPSGDDRHSGLSGVAATLDGKHYVWVHADGRLGRSL